MIPMTRERAARRTPEAWRACSGTPGSRSIPAAGAETSPPSAGRGSSGGLPKNWHRSKDNPSTHFLSTETRQSGFEQIISAATVSDIGLLEPQEELLTVEQ